MKIIPNFLSTEEINALKTWIEENKDSDIFTDIVLYDYGNPRRTTRFTTDRDINFPKEAYDIQKRIIDTLKIENFKYPPFCHGMIASYAHVNNICYAHFDPVWYEGMETIHCNVVIQKSGGAEIMIDGITYLPEEGDLMCYNVCKSLHSVTEVLDNPRMLWIFGYCMPIDEWNKILEG